MNSFATCGSFYELAATLYREAFWLVNDHLGTPRMVVNKSGSLASVKRHDYLPFGEELYAGMSGRTTTQGYTGDSTRQHFTGYEADGETGLNFAEARYQSSVQGRFTSVDPLGASANVGDPQTFNRYSYVNNNPTNLTDPSGMIPYNGADQSWGDVAGDFWGWGDLNNQPHSVGQSIVNNGMNMFPDRRDEEEEEQETTDEGNVTVSAQVGAEPQDPSGTISGTVTEEPQNSTQPKSQQPVWCNPKVAAKIEKIKLDMVSSQGAEYGFRVDHVMKNGKLELEVSKIYTSQSGEEVEIPDVVPGVTVAVIHTHSRGGPNPSTVDMTGAKQNNILSIVVSTRGLSIYNANDPKDRNGRPKFQLNPKCP